MGANYDPNYSPTALDYVIHGAFALCFLVVAVWTIVALFNAKVREKFTRTGKPPSRVSLVLALPFAFYVPAKYALGVLAIATGNDKTWAVPHWHLWFFVAVVLFMAGALFDGLRRE